MHFSSRKSSLRPRKLLLHEKYSLGRGIVTKIINETIFRNILCLLLSESDKTLDDKFCTFTSRQDNVKEICMKFDGETLMKLLLEHTLITHN